MRAADRVTCRLAASALLGLGMWAGAFFALLAFPRQAAAQTALTCGATVLGEVTALGTAAGSEIEFTYAGSAGRVITLDARTSVPVDPGFVPCWQLVTPSGAPAGARICANDQKRVLAETGTYRVQVHDQNRDQRGAFALTLQAVDAGGSCGAPISCDADDVSGSIVQPSASAALRVVGTAGERVSVSLATVSTLDPSFAPCGELYSPTGALVGTRSCGRSEPLLPETGTYTLLVTAQDHVSRGTFHASVQGLSAASTCGGPLVCDGAAAGDLTPQGDTDTFLLPAAAGDAFALHLGTTTQTDAGFEACLDVWSPSGKHPVAPSCGPVTLRAAEAGNHTVQVFAKDGAARGAYRLSLQAATQTTHCALPLACGHDALGEIEAIGDSDALAFDLAPGVVAIQVRPATIGANDVVPKWWLFSPVGVRLLVGRTGLARTTLPVAGTYTLVVADENDDETGPYAVALEGLSPATRCGPLIGCGGSAVPGRIDTRADIDVFAFNVQAGNAVTIDVRRARVDDPTDFVPCWSLSDPTGAPVLPQQCASRQVTFAAGGTFTLLVEDNFADQVGDYELTLTGTCTTTPDTDGDGVLDAVDNCPTRANPAQEDVGGVGAASAPDGLGDACQCGDVSGDGRVTVTDAVLMMRALLQPPTATLADPERCDVGGSAGCSLTDSVIVRRALLLPPTATIQQVCAPARP